MSTPDNAGAAGIIEPSKARAFLLADAANIAKRLGAGHPLTASERKTFAALAAGAATPDPTFVNSSHELAVVLGVERQTVNRWRKLPTAPKPEQDGRLDVAAWRAFKAATRAGERDGDRITTDEKARNERLRNEKLEVEVAVLRKEYVERAEVERWVAGMILTAKGVLLGLPSALAQQVVGVSAPEAEELIRDGINEALAQLHGDPIHGISELEAAVKDEGGVE
ncbi:MAG: hypothetical protein J0L84_03160 [Verrucomicrobia bacterium]|nr:hypothetical protein [Verrucomicrobiota bacterium]